MRDQINFVTHFQGRGNGQALNCPVTMVTLENDSRINAFGALQYTSSVLQWELKNSGSKHYTRTQLRQDLCADDADGSKD